MAQNEDNIFRADQCNAFDSDVDEAPTAQTMFMANLSSIDLVYDSDTISEVQDHDNCLDNMNESHEEHEMHHVIQPNDIVDSNTEYTSNNNIILYEQYIHDNEDKVVHSDVSYVPNDVVMIITNDIYEQDAPYSEHSTVTYTSVSFPVEDDSDIGSPGVDGPPIMPEDPYAYIMAAYQVPPSPDYIPGPEVPPSPDYIPGPEEPQSPPPLDFVPEPMYPEYIPQEDEILPAEEQPLPAAASPTVDSPRYVLQSDLEEIRRASDEDSRMIILYPADRDDDDDDDDEDEDKDEEVEEEHPTLAIHITSSYGRGRPAVAREDPYSVARGDLYGFVDMVDETTLMYGIIEDAQDDWSQLRGPINPGCIGLRSALISERIEDCQGYTIGMRE
ncbi:hypothetical protein Tco_0400844 [Tanacetum coccineum]